jgi:hypothetical protein
MTNVVHGSDSPGNAAVEIKRFFADKELFDIAHAVPGEHSG